MIKENNDEYKIIKERRLWKWDHHMEHTYLSTMESIMTATTHTEIRCEWCTYIMYATIYLPISAICFIHFDWLWKNWLAGANILIAYTMPHESDTVMHRCMLYFKIFNTARRHVLVNIFILYNIDTSIAIFVCRWYSGTMLNWKINRQQQIEMKPNQNETNNRTQANFWPLLSLLRRCWKMLLASLRNAYSSWRHTLCTVVHSHAHTYTI